jgi:hypothetical protein
MGELTHIKEHIGKLMGKVEENMEKCKCTMTQRILGDGCLVCNPELHEQLYQEDLDLVRVEWRTDIGVGIVDPYLSVWTGWFPGDWDMLADYFTHE